MVENYFFKAEDMFQQLHRPLPDIVRQRIFHLRNNLPERQSINLEMTWENCNGAAHNFSGPSPISTNSGASDGAVPFWSARLADTPDDQVYPLRLDTSHGSLTEDPDVLDVVNGLVHGNGLPQSASASSRPRPTIADDREIENFIRDFQSGRIDDQALATASPALKRGLVQSLSLC